MTASFADRDALRRKTAPLLLCERAEAMVTATSRLGQDADVLICSTRASSTLALSTSLRISRSTCGCSARSVKPGFFTATDKTFDEVAAARTEVTEVRNEDAVRRGSTRVRRRT